MAYEFLGPRKIVAGEPLASVPAEVRSLKGTRPLIVTDSRNREKRPLRATDVGAGRVKMAHGIFSEVEPDPDIAVAEKGKRAFVEGHYDLLIAFGGGSSIDAAKAVSFLARNDGGVKDYVGMAVFKNDPVPVVAIPTTAGTGSEVSQIAIVTDKDQKLKLPIRSPHLFPKTAILDATLLTSLPPDVIAYTGMDAFSHAVESFFSTPSNLLTEQFSYRRSGSFTLHLSLSGKIPKMQILP